MRYHEIIGLNQNIGLTESETSEPFYHVTFKSRLKSILANGLMPGKRRNWSNNFGNKLGAKQVIHLYQNDLSGAVRWAHKMEWDFEKPVVILKCYPTGSVERDMNAQAQLSGKAVTTSEPIPPGAIKGVVFPDRDLYQQLIGGSVVTEPPEWLPPTATGHSVSKSDRSG